MPKVSWPLAIHKKNRWKPLIAIGF
jgi:hypothetical protein